MKEALTKRGEKMRRVYFLLITVIMLFIGVKAYGEFVDYNSEEWKAAKSLFDRAVAQHQKGNTEEALCLYEEVVAIEPAYAEAYVNAGLIYAAKRNYNRAIDYYNKAAEILPDRWVIYYNLGVAYNAIGDKRNARLQIQKLQRRGARDAATDLESIVNKGVTPGDTVSFEK